LITGSFAIFNLLHQNITEIPSNTKKMKNLTYLLLLCSVTIFSQVGVGTTTPQTTLDIVGDPTDSSVLDGVIAPRLTGDQLSPKTYAAAQTAAIVYVTAADSSPSGQTVNVTEAGYYYFDGTEWVVIAPHSNDWKIAGNANTDEATDFVGTSNNQDVNFKRNSIQSGWLDTSNTGFGYNTINPATINTTATTGIHNTAIGVTALFSNDDGHRNTAIGSGTMTDNTTGYQNTAMGRYTMHFNTTGYNNMAIGQEAAKWNSTGHDNAAIGFNSLRYNGTGSYNVAIGRSALAETSVGDAIDNVGDNNIAIGTNAQLPDRTADNQLVLGGAPGSTIGGTSTAITQTIINGITNSAAGRPSSDSDTGVQGEIRVALHGGSRYLYICYSTDNWGRVLLDTSF
jgi:hypothetical protein